MLDTVYISIVYISAMIQYIYIYILEVDSYNDCKPTSHAYVQAADYTSRLFENNEARDMRITGALP